MPKKDTPRCLLLALTLAAVTHSGVALAQHRSCRKDRDCVLVTQSLSPCRCAPCGGRALNREAWERYKKKAPRLRCRKLPSSCAKCRPIKKGSIEAACVKGKCQVRAVRPVVTYSAPGLSGNVKTKIYHGQNCHYFRCKNCTASFATKVAASKAGYRACKKCGGRVMAPVVRPTAPRTSLTCKRNKDCGFLPVICPRCLPCKPAWRPVGNLRAIRLARAAAAKVNCAMPRCPACGMKRNWRGTRVVCFKGRCTAR